MTANKKIIFSGMRPSGRLHLGNYWGALKRWLELQNGDNTLCYFMVADLHALTTGYDATRELRSNTEEMVVDWLAAGLDPDKSVLFRQSDIPEHSELSMLFSMVTPLGWLERIPTYKEQLREMEGREIATHGFLGYPVLQAADILLYKGQGVPVGEDQLSHVELAQDIARRFNNFYGPVFPEPAALIGKTPKVPGLDTRKMSKSYGNAIEMAEAPGVLSQKVNQMYTDPNKIRANDKGHPEGCVVYAFHRIYNSDYARREKECQEGLIGCVACKKHLVGLMEPLMKPFVEKRSALAEKKGIAWEVLAEGNRKARAVAQRTMAEVRKVMGLAV